MLHGESRFFNNWQMSKEVSAKLYACDNSEEYVYGILSEWLYSTGIYDKIQFKIDAKWNGRLVTSENPHHQSIIKSIEQYTNNNYCFCRKIGLVENKMVIVVELMHYILR